MQPLWPPSPALSSASRAAAAPRRLGSSLAPWIELFLYPERFFRERLDTVIAFLTTPRLLLLIYLCGVEALIDETQRLTEFAQAVGGSAHGLVLGLALLLGPVLVGPVVYFARRFLFRLRLRLSGARNDAVQSAAAYAVIYVVWGIPALGSLGLHAIFQPDDLALGWVAAPLLGWSCYLDYTAARVAFGASRHGALFWFVTLPVLLVIGIVAVAATSVPL